MIPALWTSPPLTAEESARWTTSEERAAAAGFVSERRRAEFLTWRAVVRRELGDDVGIAYDALGAPVLTNRAVHISVAHCAGRIAVCASPERCAVDIEPATRDFRRAASRYLTPEEEALSDDPLLPGIVWCAKRRSTSMPDAGSWISGGICTSCGSTLLPGRWRDGSETESRSGSPSLWTKVLSSYIFFRMLPKR